MKRLLAALVLFAIPAVAQGPAKTQITDTLYNADGSTFSGTLRISNPLFTSADGFFIAAQTKILTITNGALSVALVPTIGATPANAVYTVVLSAQNPSPVTEVWSVPLSATPLTVAQIIVNPGNVRPPLTPLTASGIIVPGNCAKWLTVASLGDAGFPCGSGGGSSAFNAITSGTNTSAAMVVGSGASLSHTGTGTIDATSVNGVSPVAGTGIANTFSQYQTFQGEIFANRISVNQGTALTASDFSLSGWGSTASISSVSGRDQAAIVTISSSGSGETQNPTLTQNFHDGSWIVVPACRATETSGTGMVSDWTVVSRSATQYVWQYNTPPVAGESYEVSILCMGL